MFGVKLPTTFSFEVLRVSAGWRALRKGPQVQRPPEENELAVLRTRERRAAYRRAHRNGHTANDDGAAARQNLAGEVIEVATIADLISAGGERRLSLA
jgi:hypothetical protein